MSRARPHAHQPVGAPRPGADRPPDPIAIATIGWRARAALVRARGTASVVARLSGSMYLEAAGELIWLGPHGAPEHGRAVLAHGLLPPITGGDPAPGTTSAVAETPGHTRAAGRPEPQAIDFALDSTAVWRPRPLTRAADRAVLARRARAVAADVAAGTLAPGFGALLAGGRPAFPLAGVAEAAAAFAGACATGDAGAAGDAAGHLVGCGPGLTPAGDDFVGGALFARATLLAASAALSSADGAASSRDQAPAWRGTLERVRALAAARTHPISAVLLADMIAGHGHACLHDLAGALAMDAPGAGPDRAHGAGLRAARRVTRVGHSSGWDMLAGFLRTLAG